MGGSRAPTPSASRVGKVVNKYKVAKHFVLEIGAQAFRYRIDEEKVQREAALDGIYIIRTSLAAATLAAADAVRSYKQLSTVERAFRSLQDHRSEGAAHPSPRGGARARAHLPVHAGLLCRVAHERGLAAVTLLPTKTSRRSRRATRSRRRGAPPRRSTKSIRGGSKTAVSCTAFAHCSASSPPSCATLVVLLARRPTPPPSS